MAKPSGFIYLTSLIAKNFGWSEETIINLPFFKVLLYAHGINVLEGYNTRWKNFDGDSKKLTLNELDTFLE